MLYADHPTQEQPERRLKPRQYGLYPLRVRVKNRDDQAITSYTIADNLSSSGLYFQCPQTLPVNERLFVLIQLPNETRIAARGRILRQEAKPYGLTGMAICFSQTRIIPLSER